MRTGIRSSGVVSYLPSCDTAVALGDCTGHGGVLLAKNSDRPVHEAQRLIGLPPADHAAGSRVRCTYIDVPQASHTAALIGSQPYWLWGFEHGMNEHGVAIGNEAIFTREMPQESGLLGMDLLRLGLERGTSARESLNTITTLLEQYGQGGSASHHQLWYYDNSFLIADPQEAWVLETAGRQWAARRLTSGTYAISNIPTIGAEYDLASADLVAYAEDRGWWPRGLRPFHFGEAYSDPANSGLSGARCRLVRSRAHLAGGGRSPLTVRAMFDLLRDHGPGLDGDDAPLSWPTGREVTTLCMHGLADGGATAASMVAELTPGAQQCFWASMAPPCTGIFLPCWVDAGPPPPLAVADEIAAAGSPWWQFRTLWEAVATAADPGAEVTRLRHAWLELEGRIGERIGEGDAAARHALSEWACAEALRMLETALRSVSVAG